MALQFKPGPLVSLSMSCASYLGIGHHIEFFGEDGTLVLANPGADYMRGFELLYAKRPAPARSRCRSRTRSTRNSRRPHRAGVAAGQAFLRRDRKRRHGDARLCRRLSRADSDRRCAAFAPQGRWIDVARETAKAGDARMSAQVLVTGGSGFIGSGLVKALVKPAPRCACSTTIRAERPRRLADVEKDIEFIAGDIRDAAAVEKRGAGHGRGASSRLRQRHGIFLQPARPGARCRRARHDQCDRRLPQARHRHSGSRLQLRGLSDAAANPDRRERAAGRPRSAQPALFLWRRQADQRTDGDQLSAANISSAC